MSKNEYEHHQKIALHILRHNYSGLGKPMVTNEEKQTKNTVVTPQEKNKERQVIAYETIPNHQGRQHQRQSIHPLR